MPRDDLRSIRLITQSHLEGQTSAVWKSLSIRAEGLSGLALINQQDVLAKLDQQREALANQFERDFAMDPMTDDCFHRWGRSTNVPPVAAGLRVTSPGADHWKSVGMSSQVALEGDFDVMVSLDVLRFGKPKPRQNSSFYLQVELPDKAKTQANLLFLEYPHGARQVYAQNRTIRDDGTRAYERLQVASVDAIDSLRLARRGNRLTYLYREKNSSSDRVLT